MSLVPSCCCLSSPQSNSAKEIIYGKYSVCRPLNPLFSKTGENKRLKFHTRVINLHFVSLKNSFQRPLQPLHEAVGAGSSQTQQAYRCRNLELRVFGFTVFMGNPFRQHICVEGKNTAALDYSDLQMGGTPLQKTCLTTSPPPPPPSC